MESIKEIKVKVFICYHCTKKQARVSGHVHMCSSKSEIPFDMVVIESYSFIHSSIHSSFFLFFLVNVWEIFFPKHLRFPQSKEETVNKMATLP